MRKFVVLMLVLGMASLASANYTLVGGNMSLAIEGAGNGLVNAGFYLVFSGTEVASTTWTYAGTAKASDLQTDPDVQGALAGLVAPAPYTQGYQVAFADFAGTASQNGTLITYGTTGAGKAFLINADGDTVIGEAMITPEPATLAILGLGGLLLRRKK